ncbi:hypothetical protein [Limnohabitans radicicola]|uniref:Inner membrane transmembrane protein n=1 Tax=Limnohabitans radicicola TaxID=2771427 RepID=A0A927FD06_9BURK|nr:hypothetical protein [Limnohabitans radicicola]
MTPTSPALVAQNAVRRLPRTALILLSLAYVLPGFLGRAPWKAYDIEAFGFMLQLAQPTPGTAVSWLHPTLLGQVDANLALLPTWLGALFIRLAPWGMEAVAARLPFMAMLGLTLASTWFAVYALARSDAAQPVAFAFGGEARPADYARTLADGGLLALMGCLGLAQLSHEITPALSQLCFTAMLFCGLATLPRRKALSLLAVACGMLGLTLSGAPVLALMLGVGGSLIRAVADPNRSERRLNMLELGVLALLCLLSITLAGALDLWRWRIVPHAMPDVHVFGRLLLWFTWPAGPLAIWALWRWRYQLARGWRFVHIGLPVWFAAVTVGTTWFTGLTDRALLPALPAIAALAAFALPTLRRSVGAFIDWFTLLFFSICALIIWGVWISMETGIPAQPARNVARAAPEFIHTFSPGLLTVAVLATLAWCAVLRWRTGRHRPAIWKSLVLPAAGTTLCWLLLMTLWLPLLNHGRSYAPLVQKIQALTGPATCLQYAGLSKAQGAAFLYHGRVQLQAASQPTPACTWLIADSGQLPRLAGQLQQLGWTESARVLRPTDNNETLVLFKPAQD